MTSYTFFANKRKVKLVLFITSIFACGLALGIFIFFINIPAKFIQEDWLLLAFLALLTSSILLLFLANIKQCYNLSWGGQPALILTPEGIINNSNNHFNEKILIEWETIKFIEYKQMSRVEKYGGDLRKLLIIHLFNPEQFIKKHSNPLVRFILRLNKFNYGILTAINLSFIDKNVKYKNIINALEQYECLIINKANIIEN